MSTQSALSEYDPVVKFIYLRAELHDASIATKAACKVFKTACFNEDEIFKATCKAARKAVEATVAKIESTHNIATNKTPHENNNERINA